jgi:tetratricopeptide (TPR) repeat protein
MDRLETLLSFLHDDPSDPFTLFALAREYVKRGDVEAARGYYERLVAEHPRYVGTYLHLGNLYKAEGRGDDASRTYEAGIAIANELSDFHARAELQDALMALKGIGWD